MRDTVFLGYSQDELDRAYDQRVGGQCGGRYGAVPRDGGGRPHLG